MQAELDDFVNSCRVERRLLHVRRANGGRARVVPIHPALEPLVTGHLETREQVVSGPLFVGVHGRRLWQTVMLLVTIRLTRS